MAILTIKKKAIKVFNGTSKSVSSIIRKNRRLRLKSGIKIKIL